MKKSDWQYLVDTLLFISIAGITFIGILMGFVLPKGPQALESTKYILGLHRHQWGNIHFYLSLSFVCLVVIHLILSWSWIKAKARQLFKRGWITMLVLTAMGSLLVLFLFWAFYPRAPGAYEDYGVRAGRQAKAEAFDENLSPQEERIFIGEGQEYIVITGRMTLLELEKAIGIPARKIADALALPSGIGPDETLGRLSKRYQFTMQFLRDVLTKLLAEERPMIEEKPDEKDIQKMSEKKGEQSLVESPQEEHEQKLTRGRMDEDTLGILITGQMTLLDIESKTGISARRIADELNLPSGVPLHDTLGRLRRQYRFTLQEVRDAVASLMKKK